MPDRARRQLAARLQAVLRGRTLSNPTVLDVGCGDGRATEVVVKSFGRVAATGFRLVAFDLAHEKTDETRHRFCAGEWRGSVRGVTGDLYRMPFLPGSFDYVISLNVFHGIRRTELLSETLRVLKPSGVFLAYDRVPQLLPFEVMALMFTHEQLMKLVAARRSNALVASRDKPSTISP